MAGSFATANLAMAFPVFLLTTHCVVPPAVIKCVFDKTVIQVQVLVESEIIKTKKSLLLNPVLYPDPLLCDYLERQGKYP